jgi:hypothetical protein
MKIQNILSLTAGTVLFFNAGAAHAGVANGTYSIDAGADVLLWDLTESYSSDVSGGGLNIQISQEPSGKFNGTGDFFIDEDGVDLDLPAVVSGDSSGSSDDPKVSMKIFASDTDDDQGSYYINYLDVTMSLNMKVESAEGEIAGDGSASIKYSLSADGHAEKGSRSTGTGAVSFPLPSDVTGDWQLTLDLTPTVVKKETKYTGTAEVVTSVQDDLSFTVTGTYSATKDVSDLTLKGTGSAAGTSLTLVISTSGSTMNLESVKGKLYGQSLSYTAPK